MNREPNHHFARINGLRLHYLDWGGNGKPLVLLHGLTGHAYAWEPFVRNGFVSTEEYRVIALDQRGHGDSDHADDYSIGSFVSDLEKFSRQLELGNYDLVGHSMGARHAMAYAGNDYAQLNHLVLVDFGPEMERGGASVVRGNTVARPQGFRSTEQAIEYLKAANPLRSDADHEHNARHALRKNYAGMLVWKYDAEIQWISGRFGLGEVQYIWDQIAKADCPTLIVRGETTNILGPGVMQRMVEVMPTARAVEIPGADHGVPQAQPERFWQEVNAFLRS